MIDRAYCVMMARYNAWQNHSIYHAAAGLDEAARELDRGAFWGSIRKTLAHLAWADQIWIARFDGGNGPDLGGMEAMEQYGWSDLWTLRPQLDARIAAWAQFAQEDELTGDLTWHSGFLGQDLTRPKALCVVQLFNHQTHHRGQVHAMLTAAGARPEDTDLPFIPEEIAEWR
ncbi:DinB family protein [Aestuariivita sp.]|jgi:uncharacterized damage-inducible protein DinB|uniref:DinB family protein n=1 Tax=Aestuariivita sp. TaxID=1872407 RepID=UPI002174645F|nr:DinB family protein [Aestuariivita sp.]MCE8008605.1 damage-inducible protein DinB [Aestuariivita sp.]